MKWTIDVARTNFYWLTGDGLQAVDISGADMNSYSDNDVLNINVNLDVIDYGRDRKSFRVRIYLPEALQESLGSKYYDFETVYATHPDRGTIQVMEQIEVRLDEEALERYLDWEDHWKTVRYELYNETESIVIIDRGF